MVTFPRKYLISGNRNLFWFHLTTVAIFWYARPHKCAIEQDYFPDCERSRAKRGELAELASLRKARELMYRYMGKQNNWISRKLRVFDIWSIKGIIVYFYPRTHFRHEPARPDHDALWCLISKKISSLRKKFISQS